MMLAVDAQVLPISPWSPARTSRSPGERLLLGRAAKRGAPDISDRLPPAQVVGGVGRERLYSILRTSLEPYHLRTPLDDLI